MVAAVTVRKNGFAEHAFVGKVGWHGLGNELKANASIDQWKKAAGMDWDIKRSPMMFDTDGDGPVEIPGRNVLYRSDDYAPLGEVSKNYKIVQPGEVLEFFRDLVDNNGFTLDTAGTLFGGKRFWALAAIGEEAAVIGDDAIKGYMLLSTSADGSLATTAQSTDIRVVCNNTLSWALTEGKKKGARRVTVSHRSVFDPELAKTDLGIMRGNFREFMIAARKVAKVKTTTPSASEFIAKLLTDTKTIASADAESTRAHKKIMSLFGGEGKGSDLKGAAGTMWGVVNSVTEYVDHHANSSSSEHRMNDALFGRGDELKRIAFDRALEMAR